jgi:hypothetical protein
MIVAPSAKISEVRCANFRYSEYRECKHGSSQVLGQVGLDSELNTRGPESLNSRDGSRLSPLVYFKSLLIAQRTMMSFAEGVNVK